MLVECGLEATVGGEDDGEAPLPRSMGEAGENAASEGAEPSIAAAEERATALEQTVSAPGAGDEGLGQGFSQSCERADDGRQWWRLQPDWSGVTKNARLAHLRSRAETIW
jgi:hypothetical protein